METFLAVLVIALGIWWLSRRSRKKRAQQPAPDRASPRPVYTHSRPERHHPARDSRDAGERWMPFAEPGQRGPLFLYGGLGGSGGPYSHAGPFAVIDVETTGFSPAQGDRVIEIAIARVDAAGRIEDEYSTLVNPEGRDTGAVFIHRISNEAVSRAPLFGDVAGDILSRLDGSVIVAHNAVFEERFLAAELARIGVRANSLPALCSLWLGQRTFDAPNHKLSTLARQAGIPMPDAHAALGDARAVAALLPRMLEWHGASLTYPGAPGMGLHGTLPVGVNQPVTRAINLRKGHDGWMSSLLARLPTSTHAFDDGATVAYLDALGNALEDGRIIGDEAKMLARIAGGAGMGAAQVSMLNQRFLENMRGVALSDGVLTTAELRDLNRAADALGVPHYFGDLATSASRFVGRSNGVAAATKPPTVRRCGHCRTPGHNRTTCPELN